MLLYISKRLTLALLVLLMVSIATFALTNVAIDPAVAIAGENASASDIEAVRKMYALDRPLSNQYVDWIGRTLSGDLGASYRMHRPVFEIMQERIQVTFALGAAALIFALVISIALGTLAGVFSNTWVDRIALSVAVVGQAMPSFWLALLLIYVFGVHLQWLPISGADSWQAFILPAIVLGYFVTPAMMRITRAGMIDAMESDFIRTARAKGLSRVSIVFKHAFRNAMVPVVALTAVQLGYMLGGSVVIETVFAMPGMGYLAWESISASDIPLIQAIVLVMAVLYVGLVMLADIINCLIDPRLRRGR